MLEEIMFEISDENCRIEKSAFMSSMKMWTANIRSGGDSGTVSPCPSFQSRFELAL